MRLIDTHGVKDVCTWLKSKGFTPGENSFVGTVHPVHTATSLHYKTIVDGIVVSAPNQQGNLAIDVNDNSVSDDAIKWFDDETEALTWLFHRFHRFFENNHPNVLDEMFFNGSGFMKEYGFKVNHPIGGHNDHLHIGFRQLKW